MHSNRGDCKRGGNGRPNTDRRAGTAHGRGQTTQDYLIGVSVLLLTVMGVFLFVPTIFELPGDSVERNAHTQATALSDRVLTAYRVGGTTNTLRYHRLATDVRGQLPQRLLAAAGIQRRNANITVRATADSSAATTIAGGATVYRRTTTATVTRPVRFANETRCGTDGICQLIVRVW